MSEPRFLMDDDSLCYGCQFYKHWTNTDEPNYWIDKDDDIDKNGGVCDATKPCFEGSLNERRMIYSEL